MSCIASYQPHNIQTYETCFEMKRNLENYMYTYTYVFLRFNNTNLKNTQS